MKKVNRSFLFFAVLLLSFMLVGEQSAKATVAATVTFGVQPPGGGACAGRGLCTALSSNSVPTPWGTPVTFSVDPLDQGVLLATFNLSALQLNQPDQGAAMIYDANNSLPYTFVAPYSLTTALFSPLGLLPDASIQPASLVTVSLASGVVTLHIHYAHN